MRALSFGLLAIAALAGCGGEPPIIYTPSPPNNDPQMMMMMQTVVADFGGRVFNFGEASVFALGSAFRLEVGMLSGSPLKAGISVRSNSNSDEATGQVVVDSKCTFTFVTSSFPAGTKI